MTQGELTGMALRQGGAAEADKPVAQPATVFSADAATGPDHLGRTAHAKFLAEVVAHRTAGTPLCIGIFGPAGSGKSSFLAALLSSVDAIDRAATEAGIATPFHGGMTTVRITARAGLSAGAALMGAVGGVLAKSHPHLLGQVAHAGLDAREVARTAADDLNAARLQLETERQSLDNIAGRRARLAETVLFETEGSGVDTYVRGNRARIERRMRAFGVGDDPVTAFKHHVRDAHEAQAPHARASSWLRAFTAYRGQGRLLVLALVLLVLAWGLAFLGDNQDRIVASVQSGGDKMAGVADWLNNNWHWLEPARSLAELGALVAVLINVARGIGFMLPVQRGANLLRSDLDSRRRDLDSRIAHQTRRVDTITRDVDRLGQQASEADHRLQQHGPGALPPTVTAALTAGDVGDAAADHFFAALGQSLAEPDAGSPGRTSSTPARIVVGLDGLDGLSSPEAASFVQTAANLLARPSMVLIVAADHAHLATGLAETDPALAAERLRRLVQIPFSLREGDRSTAVAFARKLLAGDDAARDGDSVPVDAALSALDQPWSGSERRVLEAVAPLAGPTPRAVKQLVNLYRIARADPLLRDGSAKDLAGLALGLAVQARGLPSSAAEATTRGEGVDEVFDARRTIAAALGMPFSALDGQRGLDVARSYSTGR